VDNRLGREVASDEWLVARDGRVPCSLGEGWWGGFAPPRSDLGRDDVHFFAQNGARSDEKEGNGDAKRLKNKGRWIGLKKVTPRQFA